jgi:hypothetical protein
MGLFDGGNQVPGTLEYGQVIGDELMKALQIGYGTDSATMTGGRALVPQDIDSTVLNALAVRKNDFKLMNRLKVRKAGSSVVEYTRRDEVGDHSLVFGAEGADARASTQTLERVTKLIKYMQTYREITLQMRTANTLEDAEASEKEAGILTILKGAEYACFHGNGDVVSVQFDNAIKQTLSANGPKGYKNVVDMRGKTLQASGEDAINKVAGLTFDQGGDITDAFMPPVIASDFQAMIRDRYRTGPNDRTGAMVVAEYPTVFGSGTIKVAGQSGPDKMFSVRGTVSASGDASKRPGIPTISVASATNASTKFISSDLGTYTYAVHAISEEGISAASSTATATVASGEAVTVTITPNTTIPGTGFIVTRSKKGATTDLREVERIAIGTGTTTAYVDLNAVLPGTGDIFLPTIDAMYDAIRWDQFLPAMKFDLYPTKSAIIPFLIVMFGTVDVRVPWYHGVIQNVSPSTLGWY